MTSFSKMFAKENIIEISQRPLINIIFVNNQKETGLKYFCSKSSRMQHSKISGLGNWDIFGTESQKLFGKELLNCVMSKLLQS